jgi:protoheme IX farnesyltransferase
MSEQVQAELNTSPPLWKRYLELTKPKVVLLIVFTAVVGMLLSTPGAIPWEVFVFGNLGIALAAGSGAAVNHYVDQQIDQQMDRTMNRPIAEGDISGTSALTFALIIGALGLALLYIFTNVLTTVLTFFSAIGYAVIYTIYLKRSTPQNIVWGGAAGAAPPLLGWAAVTGEVPTEALLLFLIIFIWTPPHFWALAIKRVDEYKKVDVPMLPVTHGIPFTKQHIFLYTLMLFAVTLMPFVIQMSGLIYLSGAIALGIGFIVSAWKLLTREDEEQPMKTFAYSIIYLSALFAFFLADHYARLIIRFFM